jgi:hypothetical protein
MTVRACSGKSFAKGRLWSLVKHTTSQRPAPGPDRNGGTSTSGTVSTDCSANDGKRFSNTATS